MAEPNLISWVRNLENYMNENTNNSIYERGLIARGKIIAAKELLTLILKEYNNSRVKFGSLYPFEDEIRKCLEILKSELSKRWT